MGVGNGVDAISTALRRAPRSMVEVEVGAVLLAPAGRGLLAQLMYDRVDRSSGTRSTFAVVHHTGVDLRAPATYERVHPGAPLLGASEIDAELPRGRGLRWLTPADPGGRAWPLGLRLVRLVDDTTTATVLAGHFGVPLRRARPPV